MTLFQKFIKFLIKNKVKYEIISHRTVYTAFDKAATLKVKPKIIGKTLILKTNSNLVIALVPGDKNLDKNKFKKIINSWLKKQGKKPVKNVDFISEKLMKNKFKGVKVGAIPPLGSFWGLPTFIDKSLLKEKTIIINGGDYNCSLKISPITIKKLLPDLIIDNFSKAKK